MKKRLFATALAGIMAITSLAATASAATLTGGDISTDDQTAVDGGETPFKITLNGLMAAPAIKVAAPSGEANFMLNPYSLDVVTGKDAEDKDIVVSDQVISKVMNFHNMSDTKLDVFITAKGTIGASNTTLKAFATAEPKPGDTGNQAILYVVASDKGTAAVTTIDTAASYDKTKHNVVSVAGTEMKMIEALEVDDGDAENDYEGNTKQSWAAVNIQGKMSDKPKTPWNPADTVSVDLIYRFELVSNAATS